MSTILTDTGSSSYHYITIDGEKFKFIVSTENREIDKMEHFGGYVLQQEPEKLCLREHGNYYAIFFLIKLFVLICV